MHRCHGSAYEGHAFNPGNGGGGRFHWFADRSGNTVPVLYAADCYQGAVAETIFRNVPLSGRRTVYQRNYRGRTTSVLQLDSSANLELVEFHDPGLLRLGVRPRRLTETNSAHYGRTVRWAEAVHQQIDVAQGIVWISGRFNTARAVMLFGDRVDPTILTVVPRSAEQVDSVPGLARLVKLANEAGITVAKQQPRRKPRFPA
ncbi:RES domain-containing protein [Umezawaea tangerina]|uniref:RES domain-containing protein n=1 Tax=Umezawaea tangerina TaxID=84725 RepID=A0A2T0T490_9PSEU|nr:RES family NAD+ phosphorylase [Umezawaea tangerina]PRY40498.1 RES domain-containing protein [Umezawaea tangerina]